MSKFILDNNSDVLLSIVVPMFNSFDLLKNGISVLERDKHRECIELLIIDDCSRDDSYENMIDYAKKSNLKIRIMKNKSNSGPGCSRNNGIENAVGRYITFLDSDDSFTDDFLSRVIPILKTDIDCLIFDYLQVDGKGVEISKGNSIGCNGLKKGFLDPSKALVFTYGSTWGKVYKKSIIDNYNVRFANLFRNEDMPFTKHAIAVSKSIYYLPEYLYKYVQIPTSLMHTSKLNDEKNCQNAFLLLKEKIDATKYSEELVAIELREVLNNSVLIKINRGDSCSTIREYINISYRKEHLCNCYFAEFPRYARVISLLAYHRGIVLLRII